MDDELKIQSASQETDRESGIDEFDLNSEAESAAKPSGFKIPKKVDISHAVALQDGQDMIAEEDEDVMEHDGENEFDDMVFGKFRFFSQTSFLFKI